MDETTRHRIRHIFLSPRPNFPLMTAAELPGMTLGELKREVEVGAIPARMSPHRLCCGGEQRPVCFVARRFRSST